MGGFTETFAATKISARVRWLLHLFLLLAMSWHQNSAAAGSLMPLVKTLASLLIFYVSHFGFVRS